MKRILAITPTYFPMMGGAERTVDELYKRLGKLGYEIDLVTPNLGGKKFERIGRFNIYRVGKKTSSRALKFLLYQWYEYKKIKELLKRRKYDLIHVSYGFPNYFIVSWLKNKLRCPLVITEFHLGTGMDIISETQNPWYVNYFLGKIYKKAERITAISNEQKRFVESISKRDDIIVVFQGTDEKYFSPKKHDEKIKEKYNIKGPFLLTVSRLNKRKNIRDQIKAMSLVIKRFPNAKLVIVGKGEEEKELKALTKRLNLETNVMFAGFVSEKELPRLYATADIFILTSKLEGFGIANCEALASNTPVITYDTSAAKDFIIDGKTGFITKHDYKLFAKKIIKLLSDKTLLKKMSRRAREVLEKGYTWDIYTKRHKEVFDKLLR